MDELLKALYGKFETLRLAGVRWLPVGAAPAPVAASAGVRAAAPRPGAVQASGPGPGGWAGVANQMKQELEKKAAGARTGAAATTKATAGSGGAVGSTAKPSPGPKGPPSPKGEGVTVSAAPSMAASGHATQSAAGATDESLQPNRTVTAETAAKLEAVRATVSKCVRCQGLAATRRQTVFSDGPANAEVMFIGEAPGEDEDKQGLPFVGRAGQLLNKIIVGGMKMRREDVYICNIIKCRPPDNRQPLPDEAAHCREYLEAQIELIRPRVICCLGAVASQFLLDDQTAVGKMRGRWLEYRGIPVRVTYHPAYLLRNYTPDARQKVWDDVVAVVAKVRELREQQA